eukprot:12511318-Ditylum_brightwellii.AAC.1
MSDKDSTRTAPLLKPYHVMKTAAKQWQCLDNAVKAVWKKRAVKLNIISVPGSFQSFPKEISKELQILGNRFYEELVFESLKLDWEM